MTSRMTRMVHEALQVRHLQPLHTSAVSPASAVAAAAADMAETCAASSCRLPSSSMSTSGNAAVPPCRAASLITCAIYMCPEAMTIAACIRACSICVRRISADSIALSVGPTMTVADNEATQEMPHQAASACLLKISSGFGRQSPDIKQHHAGKRG